MKVRKNTVQVIMKVRKNRSSIEWNQTLHLTYKERMNLLARMKNSIENSLKLEEDSEENQQEKLNV